MSRGILHMKIDLKLKDALVNSATQQNRSLANLVETALFEYLAESKHPAGVPAIPPRPEGRGSSRRK